MQGNNPLLKERAQELRKNGTRQERHLWYDFLKYQKPQFHRQVTMGRFIVDFYCPKQKLVIELDGSQHFETDAMAYDRERTQYLEGLGCRVVRFTNAQVDNQFSSVCQQIYRFIHPTEPSP